MSARIVYLKTSGGAWMVCRTAQGANLAVSGVDGISDADVARIASQALIAAPSVGGPYETEFSALGEGRFINLYSTDKN